MAQLYTLSILFLLSISLCVGEEIEKKIEINLNNLIDRANPLIAAAIKESNLDPLKLPNITKTIALSTVNITNGYLYGLSKIQRNKPATLTYESKTLTFYAGFGIKNVTMNANYALKRIWTKRNGKVTAFATPLDIEIELSFNLKTHKFTLNTFKVGKIKQIKVKLTGNDNSDWITNAITNAVAAMLNNYITETISNEVSSAIKSFLGKLGSHPGYDLSL